MKPGHDLSGLIKFAGRDDWRPHLESAMGDHFGAAMEEFNLDFEAIGDVLGEHWAMTLWGCAFEDLLTRVVEPGGRNLVEDYLKRRGWKETASAKAYMRALQISAVSLYEVSDIVAGKSFLAQDLVRGGDPVLVSERSASRTLAVWDRIAARIVPQGPRHVLSGGLLPFTMEAADALLEGLRKAEGKHSPRAQLAIGDAMLRELAPLFTTAWLFDTLGQATGAVERTIYNSDGEEVVFHHVRFPLAAGVTQKDAASRLDALPELRRENAWFWNWLGGPPPARPLAGKAKNALAWNVTMDDGAAVLGNIETKGRAVVLSVSSAGRAARGITLLQATLGKLVGPPLTEVQMLDQLRAEQGDMPSGLEAPEEVTELVHAMLDQQYRATLDEPVGMLGDISPRAASRTAAGRERVVAWLKHLENRSASQRDPADPMATYDFAWMWRELGVADMRQ